MLPKLFGPIDDEVFTSILPLLEWVELNGNSYLFRQGAEGDSLYLLVSGRLQAVVRNERGRGKVVGEISRGETVGEMSIFTGEPRAADIRAVRDSQLVRISKPVFERISQRYPSVLMNITRLIIDRLKRNNEGRLVTQRVTNIALVPLSEGIDLKDFSNRLTAHIQTFGTTLQLSADSINERSNTSEYTNATLESGTYHRFSNWLNEQEAHHDYLVYQANYGADEWSKRCLRQADKIVLVAKADDDTTPREVERLLLSGDKKLTSAKQVLVLLHTKDQIEGTLRWTQSRQLNSFHHVVSGRDEHLRRLSRFLTGNAVGLVLSGGGARGLAHIGVYRALAERNVPVDIVGGTSMGSIVAGVVATGRSADELNSIARRLALSNPTPLRDYNVVPIISLLTGRKLNRVLREALGEVQIEDLPTKFFCVSSNLTQTSTAIHQRGSLRLAVRASISLPGIFPPAIIGNDLHVDGAIFNNLPIDVMADQGVGHIIAVDLDIGRDDSFLEDRMPSSWQVIGRRIRGNNAQRVPTIVSTIIQSTTLNSLQKTRKVRDTADLYFNPNLDRFGFMDWKKYDQIVAVGYAEAQRVLADFVGFVDK